MNEKFYDLPKEKQDRMINGAMQVIAENGYKHASTDEMVKVSGVSKGLWFHYFDNKNGLYYYVCSYAVKYALLEYGIKFNEGKHDFFEIYMDIERIRVSLAEKYPYLPLLLSSLKTENDPDALELMETARKKFFSEIERMHLNADISCFENSDEALKLRKMLSATFDEYLRDNYRKGVFSKSAYIEYVGEYLKMTRNILARQG